MVTDLLLRIALAGLLGGFIGIERQLRAKEAGLRTHILVGIGSAMFMIVSKYGFEDILLESHVALDPSRIAAQVVSGMGFLGAGTIIIQKQVVKGLTTAAGMWVTAAIGTVIGSGLYEIGIYGAVLTLVVLEVFRQLSNRLLSRHCGLLVKLGPDSVASGIYCASDEVNTFCFSLSEKKFLRRECMGIAFGPDIASREFHQRSVPGNFENRRG